MKIKSLVLVVVLITAVLCFGVAKAQTTDVATLIAQLQAQIANLMAQLQALQAQQNGTTAWCYTFNVNIGMGQKTGNPEINALVIALQKEGIIAEEKTFDGYDENLASNVVAFQEKYTSEILTTYNLKHGTGYVGKSTRAKLNSLYGCETTHQCKTDSDCPIATLPCALGTTSIGPKCVSEICTERKCIP